MREQDGDGGRLAQMARHASERELEQPRATKGAQHQQVGAEIEGGLPDGLAGRMLAGFQLTVSLTP